jgi:hypothetical protein
LIAGARCQYRYCHTKGTQEDKDKLGYLAIKKLHEKMDDDRDGQVEVQETKEVSDE